MKSVLVKGQKRLAVQRVVRMKNEIFTQIWQ
jgi:hypothetical protein